MLDSPYDDVCDYKNYAMVINGKLCGHIIPEQGLRQTTFISYFS
jgi:hypothetical protein